MRLANIVSLMDSSRTTCNVVFAAKLGQGQGQGQGQGDKVYTYRCAKCSVEKGDFVVVPTSSGGWSIALVATVDSECRIDLDAPYVYKDIVGKICFEEYVHVGIEENEALNRLSELKGVLGEEAFANHVKELLGERDESF